MADLTEDTLIVRTREAHEAIKDLRMVLREIREAVTEGERTRDRIIEAFALGVNDLVDQRIASAVSTGLEAYASGVQQAIDDAEESVIRRFESLQEWLYNNKEGQPTIKAWQMEQVQEVIDKRITDALHLDQPDGA